MKLFVVNTSSESSDHYSYVIRHTEEPTADELKAFLIKHSCDKDNFTLYESVENVIEVTEKNALIIPKVSQKILDEWSFL